MRPSWLQGVDPDEREAREKLVKEYSDAWNLLYQVLRTKLKRLPEAPDYTNPAWAYEMANINGQNKMLREILGMLEDN
jgi:hypothetical protein